LHSPNNVLEKKCDKKSGTFLVGPFLVGSVLRKDSLIKRKEKAGTNKCSGSFILLPLNP